MNVLYTQITKKTYGLSRHNGFNEQYGLGLSSYGEKTYVLYKRDGEPITQELFEESIARARARGAQIQKITSPHRCVLIVGEGVNGPSMVHASQTISYNITLNSFSLRSLCAKLFKKLFG